MKQLLSLALALIPCLAWAQYPSNGNQKITLGEQTTADGLVYRGRLSDTANLLTNKLDTSAYIVLDTNTRAMWYYRVSSTPKWTRLVDSLNNLQGQLSLTTKVTGTLPVENGGTGSSSKNFVDLSTTQTVAGAKTFSNAATFSSSVTATSFLVGTGTFNFSSGDGLLDLNASYIRLRTYKFGVGYITPLLIDTQSGNVGIGTASPSELLHVAGIARITGAYDNTDAGAANVFVTTTGILKRSTSSIKYKTEVEDYTKGLSDVLKLRPVTYKSINSNDNKIYAGFIAEELSDLKLSELLQNNEEGEPDAISYAYIVTLLTKAIQDQNVLIKELEKRILTLENK